MSLSVEMRPKTFDDFVGNKPTIVSLKNNLGRFTKPHTYMFIGPSGCGKTTLARIAAYNLGCDEFSIQELNAANTRGIDTIREIVENASLHLISSDVKCYIFDESHQLTKQAQEALLKLIEEPPLHCYFFFCTTNPRKIIATIKNRCSKYYLKKLNKKQIEFLLDIAQIFVDNVLDDILLSRIIDVSNGIPREALNLFEKVLGLSVENGLELINECTEENSEIIQLCRSLVKGNWKSCFDIYDKIEMDPEQIKLILLGYLGKCLANSDSEKEAERWSSIIQKFETSYQIDKAHLLSEMYQACRRRNQ